MIKDWNGQRVLIIGAARQGLALARYLSGKGAQVTLNDRQPAEKLAQTIAEFEGLPIHWVLGSHPLELLDAADLVCVSGGIPLNLPLIVQAQQKGLPLTNDSQIFIERAPCRVIGITGSAGKSTTTTLVGRMAEAHAAMKLAESPTRVWVGGNLGLPLITYLDDMQPSDLVVLELSSFQLEQMTVSPNVAAILNITPNHLDRHGTMEAYTAAKAHILQYQSAQDIAILNRDDPGAWSLLSQAHGSVLSFGLKEPMDEHNGTFLMNGILYLKMDGVEQAIVPENSISLRGKHNTCNVLAACAIAAAAGIPRQAMQKGVEGFTGIAHRLEWVRDWRGSHWYNDSIATTPERAAAAIHSFDEPLILLAGGRDKNLPWQVLADLIHQRVDHLIIFGEAADIIVKAVGSIAPGKRPYSLTVCAGLQQAVQAAAQVAKTGDVVLLSPGGTSFDEFIDFEERGESFRKWVMELS
jgi:UDP-N-acetylmuramoylalanine--D-glutamate ligase